MAQGKPKNEFHGYPAGMGGEGLYSLRFAQSLAKIGIPYRR